MSLRLRIVLLGVVVAVVAASAVLYVGHLRQADAVAPADQLDRGTMDPATALAGPHIVFRSASLGPDYGKLAVVPTDAPAGPRALLDSSCERVYATEKSGVCITAKRGVVQTYAVTTLDAQLHPVASEPLTGLPSRARISADGSLVATTTFVSGHSYAETSFSTDTVVRRNGKPLANLENFTTFIDGHELKAIDRNFWGVTFTADPDVFYATAASSGTTWLVRGSFQHRRMDSLRTDAECPSLSPDGTKIAYKKRLGVKTPGVWRLAVLDLAGGRETLSAETRSVDDQVEWLDGDHILYGMSRSGSEGTVSDVWVVPADGTGAPSVLISQASSPAVVAM